LPPQYYYLLKKNTFSFYLQGSKYSGKYNLVIENKIIIRSAKTRAIFPRRPSMKSAK